LRCVAAAGFRRRPRDKVWHVIRPKSKVRTPRNSGTPCPAWRNGQFRSAGGVSIFDVLFEFACRFPGPLRPRPGRETAQFAALPNRFAADARAIRDGGRRPASAARRRGRPPRPPERIRAGTGPGTGAVARGRTACPFGKAGQDGQAILPPTHARATQAMAVRRAEVDPAPPPAGATPSRVWGLAALRFTLAHR